MKNLIGIIITLLFLGYGIIRIGVGGALMAQASHLIDIPDLSEAVMEVQEFLESRSEKGLVPLAVMSYVTYILVMGILLSAGAIATLFHKRLGFKLLWTYILSHSALFINYAEINPKLFVLAAQIVLVGALHFLKSTFHKTQ